MTETHQWVLRAEKLTKHFGELRAVDNVSYGLRPGEVAGIIGPNGAGKTTFFNLITGALYPDAGTVWYRGRDITRLPPDERVMLGIRRTFQLTSTFDELTVVDNLRLAHFRARRKSSSLGAMLAARMEAVNDPAIDGYIERFGLSRVARSHARHLSLGDKRKLEIAMALIGEPAVLLLDEPFAGLSEKEITEVIEVLRQGVGRMAILIVEHKITKLRDLAQRITVFAGGQVIADGEYQEVLESPQVRRSYWQLE